MKKHPFFDLQVMDNQEITEILGKEISARETLTQWPLSCVEKIVCTDRSKWIAKSNHQPCDIEGLFYEQVDNAYTVKPIHIQSSSPYQTIIYRYIEGLSYSVVNLNKKQDTEHSFRDIFAHLIASIDQPNLPVYLKIDTEKDFLLLFQTMLTRLSTLLENGIFSSITGEELQTINEIIESSLTLEIALSNTGLVHGDFSVDNIIFDNDADQLIFLDWQRPIYGSPLIDEYSFVKSKGFKPDSPAILIGSLVQINWLTDCAVNWFKEGYKTYNQQTKELLKDLITAYQTLKTNQIKM